MPYQRTLFLSGASDRRHGNLFFLKNEGRCISVYAYNKPMLEEIMHAYGDKCKDLAGAIGMSVPNFSTIWNGRGEFNLKYIRLIARRYSLSPQQVYDIFIFPRG